MKSLFSKIRQIGTSPKKPNENSEIHSDDDDDSRKDYPFPRVAQSRNDSRVEVAQSVYGRGTGKHAVKFIVQDILGKGHYGMVFLALEETTGRLFAVKVMKKEVRNINKYAHIEEAVLRMTRVCPFIIHMFSSFQTTNSFYLVMEYAEGGNLKQVIDEYGCLTINSARFLAAELILALHFLHGNGVIHRDLKIQNILMTGNRHLRLIDFGLSRMDIYDGDTTNSGCGTPFYMAPEILRRIPYSHEVDWWALGVVLYKIITGTFPFMGKTNPEVFVAVTRDSVYYDPHLPADLVSLFKGLLRKNPSKRLGYGNEGWRQIQAHTFFSSMDWQGVSTQTLAAPPYERMPEEPDTDTHDSCESIHSADSPDQAIQPGSQPGPSEPTLHGQ
ncbi:protein kinase C beta type-like isoform X2 [Littorina saxatilis]|uniref:Protein kinase domain-containing protein n=1 Tax=Littorina saxatilis TaxID=31220 RepID=A0AAN9BY97_9CAEN